MLTQILATVRPRIQTKPLAAVQVTQTSIAPVGAQTKRPQVEPRLEASRWPSVATWATDTSTDPGCCRETDPDMFPDSSSGLWTTPWPTRSARFR